MTARSHSLSLLHFRSTSIVILNGVFFCSKSSPESDDNEIETHKANVKQKQNLSNRDIHLVFSLLSFRYSDSPLLLFCSRDFIYFLLLTLIFGFVFFVLMTSRTMNYPSRMGHYRVSSLNQVIKTKTGTQTQPKLVEN